MNLGFDFDKIFVDYPPFIPNGIIDRLYKKKSNGELLYRIPSRLEQILRLISHQSIFRPLIKENLIFLKKIRQKNNHKYYLISSRFSFLKKPTQGIIKKCEFDKIFNAMYFNFENEQPHIFKNEVIKKLKINRYIDDDLPLIKFLANENPKTFFFWLNKKDNKKLSKNLMAVTKINKILS
ncbi:MAG: hypothetical protein ABH816_01130 [Candidatus Levyibacteriota bacterium]